MKILIAMSGGVDSSVVAHLLKQQGHEVVGMMMKLWTDPQAPESRDFLPKKCCSIEHIQRARGVCADLDIPFYVVNFEQEFKEEVVDFYLASHAEGNTPNPCIECNKLIKFGALLKKVDELGFDALATGHYAQVVQKNGKYHLLQSKDEKKDQSYYLYTLTQQKLSKILFPLGGLTKPEVFTLAKKFDISIPDTYAESEDLCFYPENNPNEFLKRYLSDIPPGPIIDEEGNAVGEHKGLPFYTIGQRKGLNIGGLKIPLHVSKKDPENNRLIVAQAGKDMSTTCTIANVRWIAGNDPEKNECFVRTSSLGTKHPCTFTLNNDGSITITLAAPVRGLAPGQAAVFYEADEVLGGGIIKVSKGA